jgi:hypothetical protein
MMVWHSVVPLVSALMDDELGWTTSGSIR